MSEQSSGAIGRLKNWLTKPAFDDSPGVGPQVTRLGLLFVMLILGVSLTPLVIWVMTFV